MMRSVLCQPDASKHASRRCSQATLVEDVRQAFRESIALLGKPGSYRGRAPLRVLKPGARFGEFEILAGLGRGGMGAVYRARQESLDREVALKVLLDREPGGLTRFRTEWQTAAHLQHASIVRVHSQGVAEGCAYYAMAYVDGSDLGQMLAQGPLDGSSRLELVRFLADVADALAYAHERGIVHGDVKPRNILISREGRAYLCDFGVARTSEETPLLKMGTPAYVSPEQLRGRAVDHRADVYSLGVTLYEVLTGQRPFAAEACAQLLGLVLSSRPCPPRAIDPAIPLNQEQVCLRAMEKEPHRRFPSMAEMAHALHRCTR